MDFMCARLTIRLEKEEIEATLASNDASEETTALLTDRLAALETHKHELQALEESEMSQRVQRSMYVAMLGDRRVLEECRKEEQQAIDDRNEAARLAGQNLPVTPNEVREQVRTDHNDDETLALVEEILSDDGYIDNGSTAVGAPDDDNMSQSTLTVNDSNSTLTAASLHRYMHLLRIDETRPPIECEVCTETVPASRIIRLPCGTI